MNTLQASDFNYTINTQSGTSYTLVASDLGRLIRFTNSGSVTLTVPADSSVLFDVGDRVNLLLDSAGTVNVQGASGVAISAEGSVLQLNTRYSLATLLKLDANSWMLTGVIMNTITDGEVTESKIAANAVTSGKIADGTIVNADINASAAIAHSKLASITAGQVLIGNASNVPTATALSGDVTVSSTGVTAIGSGVIVNADINASAAIDKTKISGTAITAADTGTVTSTMIADGTIVNADISSTAGIERGKIADLSIDTKTANYSLVLGDKNKVIEMNVGSANTVTVPLNSAHAFPIGSQVTITQYGAGKTQVVATGGVTVRATPGSYLRAQYSTATLIKRGTDEWYLIGDLSST
jgi:hypothetical protein